MADKKAKPVIIIKKKIMGGHGAHGGAWKVAYADFVTAMMAFFLVLWLLGTDEDTKKAISQYFNHPDSVWKTDHQTDATEIPVGEGQGLADSVLSGLNGMNPDAPVAPPVSPIHQDLQKNQNFSQLVEDSLDGRVYGLDVNIEYMKFSVNEDMLFDPSSTQLAGRAGPQLDKLGKLLKGYDGYVTIEGHTDSPATTTGKYSNAYEYTLARAVSVMNYLVDHHYGSEEKYQPIGSGGRRSLASNETNTGRSQNRRIEFTLRTERSP